MRNEDNEIGRRGTRAKKKRNNANAKAKREYEKRQRKPEKDIRQLRRRRGINALANRGNNGRKVELNIEFNSLSNMYNIMRRFSVSLPPLVHSVRLCSFLPRVRHW